MATGLKVCATLGESRVGLTAQPRRAPLDGPVLPECSSGLLIVRLRRPRRAADLARGKANCLIVGTYRQHCGGERANGNYNRCDFIHGSLLAEGFMMRSSKKRTSGLQHHVEVTIFDADSNAVGVAALNIDRRCRT
jgi:hypothetical protein